MRTSWMATMRRVMAACVCAALTMMAVPVGAEQDRLAGVRHAPEGAPIQLTLKSGTKIVGSLVRVSGDEVTIREGLADESRPADQVGETTEGVRAFSATELKDARVIMPIPVLPDSPVDRSAGEAVGNYVVRTTEGAELRGQLERMDRDSLTLRIGTEAWTVLMDRVDSVQRRGDSLKNGATIGAVVGGGLAAAFFGVLASLDLMSTTDAFFGTAVNAAFYGLVGAGIDKAVSSNTTLYQRPRLALAPTRGGVVVLYHLPLGGH